MEVSAVLPVLDEFLFGRFERYASAESKLLSESVFKPAKIKLANASSAAGSSTRSENYNALPHAGGTGFRYLIRSCPGINLSDGELNELFKRYAVPSGPAGTR
jgi:hypothetical protein